MMPQTYWLCNVPSRRRMMNGTGPRWTATGWFSLIETHTKHIEDMQEPAGRSVWERLFGT